MRSSTISSQKKDRTPPGNLPKAMLPLGKGNPTLVSAKKQSALIAKNPKRYLDNYVQGIKREGQAHSVKFTPPVDTNSLASLVAYIDESKSEDKFGRIAENLEYKYKLSKTRTLLLNVSSAWKEKAIKRGSNSTTPRPRSHTPPPPGSSGGQSGGSSIVQSPKFQRPSLRLGGAYRGIIRDTQPTPGSSVGFIPGDDDQDDDPLPPEDDDDGNEEPPIPIDKGEYYGKRVNKNELNELDRAIHNFVERIKNSDIDKIIIWINTLATNHDSSLPYGIPWPELLFPMKVETIKVPELRSYVESSLDEFMLLDGEYASKLEDIMKRLEENWMSLSSSPGGGGPGPSSSPNSSWTPKDSALLFYIITALEESPHARFRQELIQKLFPQFTEEEISSQKYRLRMKRAWEEKRAVIIKSWVKDRTDLVKKINEGWTQLEKELTKKHELLIQRTEQLERCLFWKKELERLRKEKRSSIRRIQIQIEPFEKALEAKERQRLEEEERRRVHQKHVILEYKDHQSLKLEELEREKGMREKEIGKLKKMQGEYNKVRVAHRQNLLAKREEEHKLQEKKREAEMIEKLRLLEESKYKVDPAQVPYEPGNALKDTYSSMLRRYEVQALLENEEETKMIKFFRDRYNSGFTSEQVMRDRRIRVEGKLREAGLIESPYARQVLLAMEPKPKPHLVSNVELKDEEN